MKILKRVTLCNSQLIQMFMFTVHTTFDLKDALVHVEINI